MSAQFFGRSGKVLYGAFSIVGMAYQSQNVNNGIPDDRVARSKQNETLSKRKIYKEMFKPQAQHGNLHFSVCVSAITSAVLIEQEVFTGSKPV